MLHEASKSSQHPKIFNTGSLALAAVAVRVKVIIAGGVGLVEKCMGNPPDTVYLVSINFR